MTRSRCSWLRLLVVIAVLAFCAIPGRAADVPSFESLAGEYQQTVRPLLKKFCFACHSTEVAEGDLDLEQFAQLDDVRRATKTWLKVAEMLGNGEMPPKEGRRLPAADRSRLQGWIAQYLRAEALASAGDPGPVVLRRLSNAQYTYTIQDLTGIDLQPAREFPADSAAGEGFTNTGSALVMSPALLTKYFDAAKGIAAHAVLLPDGLRFSRSTTRRDWTEEILRQIRTFYGQFADAEGRLPLEPYLAATLELRNAPVGVKDTPDSTAQRRGLNARYLSALWELLNSQEPSLLLEPLRERWRAAKLSDAPALAADIAQWQKALMAFQKVGHMKPWVVAVNPVTTHQEMRFKFPDATDHREAALYLIAHHGGATPVEVIWQQARLIVPGRPDVPLHDLRDYMRSLIAHRQRILGSTTSCLAAVAQAARAQDKVDVAALARQQNVDMEVLSTWLDYLGFSRSTAIHPDLLTGKLAGTGGYSFVNGWGSPETPNIVTNSSDEQVRIPGTMKPHGVALHPSPTHAVAIGWRSPIMGIVQVEAVVTHAHPECGNGVAWALEVRHGTSRQRLASGVAVGPTSVKVGPFSSVAVQPGNFLSLIIGPRDGNHACDLTDVALTVRAKGDGDHTWDLAGDISGDVLAGNPHADRQGNAGIWHFYKELVQQSSAGEIPSGSLLARWLAAPGPAEKATLATALERLLQGDPPTAKDHPDSVLYRQLTSLSGPLLTGQSSGDHLHDRDRGTLPDNSSWGLDPALFGHTLDGRPLEPTSLCVRTPAVLEVRLPSELVAGCELAATAVLEPARDGTGTAQVHWQADKPTALSGLHPDAPILVADNPSAQAQVIRDFDEFRRWFPMGLCYRQVVPTDEVITLTLFHREDEPLRRLMLDSTQATMIDQLWDELHFVSQDALTIVDAYAQILEYATQDSDPRLLEPFRKPIRDRAEAFRKALATAEPRQLDAVLAFAARAFRRPLTDKEAQELKVLYQRLRAEQVPHDEAIRLTLARALVAPAFLYRIEKSGSGVTCSQVTDHELASRLSYFLWSSMPDDELRSLANAGRLHELEVFLRQIRRMQRNTNIRRLATEFACQWLHIYEFDTLDEKSERHFPAFNGLRGAMYEEAIRFFTDLFQEDRSLLSVLDADHTFVNEPLAAHYGISGVTGPEWRRVDSVHAYGRGGILALSATLAKQSGASRTSPILRGNWISEVLLGEKLPKPPKDVPRLPEDETAGGSLTVRQLVEQHTRDASCAHCHSRIDPFGFALEGFDAIGRRREKDLGNRPVDVQIKLQDGTEIDGLDGLRHYLLTTRRDAVVRQICRKLLGYALGRSVQLSDEPLLDEMLTQLKVHDFRISIAIETIVCSRQFREIRGREMATAEAP